MACNAFRNVEHVSPVHITTIVVGYKSIVWIICMCAWAQASNIMHVTLAWRPIPDTCLQQAAGDNCQCIQCRLCCKHSVLDCTHI